MNEFKGTPGPWHLTRSRNGVATKPNLVHGNIAESTHPDRDKADANARLMKVAPDLLALVQRAARDSTVTTSDGPGCFYCDHVSHTADCPAAAAINKALNTEE